MAVLYVGLIVLVLVMLQNYLYRKFWKNGLSLDLKFSAKEAFEGDNLYLQEELVNKKILPLTWLLVRFKVSKNLVFNDEIRGGADLQNQSDVFSIMMYQSIGRKMFFRCSKRGYYRLRNVDMTASNLLHTQNFMQRLDFNTELTVFPKILDDYEELDMMYKALDAAILSHSLINPDPFEFKGIREYNPTDPLRDINFKASAVAQQLMVNVHAPTSAKRLEIILNLEYHKPYPNLEIYEQAIRLAATAAGRYINDDVKVGFFCNGSDAFLGNQIRVFGGNSTAHLYSIYQALAGINLMFKPGHIAEHLESLDDVGAVYFIISSYHGKDFLNALESLKNSGHSYMVVVPTEDDMEINVEETGKIRLWKAL